MNKIETIDQLKRRAHVIKDMGATSLYLFGSFAQDQAKPGSDLDVFRSCEQMQPKYGYQWGVQAEQVRPQPRRLLP